MSHKNETAAENKAKLDAHFEKVAQSYEADGKGAQNAICRALLALSAEFNHPITSSSVVLDNAAGPGILTGELLKQVLEPSLSLPPFEMPAELHAADFSTAMIRVLNDKGWGKKYGVQAAVMDAQDLKYPDSKFTHVFMNLGIFALPDPLKGTQEIFRTLQLGGIALVTTIRGVGWTAPFQAAQKRIRPDVPQFQGMLPPQWAKPEKIRTLMEQGGFKASNIDMREASTPMDVANFSSSQEGLSKMARDMIVKGWAEGDVVSFDKALEEELQEESKRNSPRSLDVWVCVAVK